MKINIYTEIRGVKKKDKPLIKGVIYKWTNKLNGKIYIGQTINEDARIKSHINRSKLSNNKTNRFYNAIRKYKIENFEYSVLFKIYSKELDVVRNWLDDREISCIKFWDSTNKDKGYNIQKGGSQSLKEKYTSITKIIVQLTTDFHFIKEWSNMKLAAKTYNTHVSNIIASCKRKNKTCCGYIWMYKEDYDNNKNNLNKWFYNRSTLDKPIIKLSLLYEYIEEFPSLKDACNACNIVCSTSISEVCKHIKTKSRAGYKWIYKEDYEIYKSNLSYYIDHSEDIYNKSHDIFSVKQYSLDGRFIKEWKDFKDAAKEIGLKNPDNIRKVVRGKSKTAGGFIWK